ncbi:MAG: RNase adapter RapZ [Legionellaceae bacterium]|nr:RNase adapter RapZ [Legionellaceae bacterium]
MRLLIISGRSGSGKSAALHMLEDLDYYCVDNLPVHLLPHLLECMKGKQNYIAISIDARNLPGNENELPALIKELRNDYQDVDIIYLDADNNTLLKRFSETRRKHPLGKNTLKDAIELETHLLEPIANSADLQIDTSHMTTKELREIVYSRIYKKSELLPSLLFQSFGYKRGIPIDTDYTFDIRCLPNPYWEKSLREKTGSDQAVIDFFESQKPVEAMYNDIKNFIEKWLPAFEKESRKYLTISIGCTGGQHRSVYLVDKLAAHFLQQRDNVLVRHRELS